MPKTGGGQREGAMRLILWDYNPRGYTFSIISVGARHAVLNAKKGAMHFQSAMHLFF